jgi:25S rRNA (uracil2843-N3)-methyltransferase
MGKNGKFGKDYGKVVGKDSKNRPGWKGPGYVKKAEPPAKPKPTQAEKSDSVIEPLLPSDLHQLLLNIFRDAFPEVLNSDTLQPLLQSVKSALYERDFTRAFGREDHLEAYSIRWSPSRALGYASILIDLRKHLAGVTLEPEAVKGKDSDSPLPVASRPQSTLQVTCFGGGAAEVVAFGGFLRFLKDSSPTIQGVTEDESTAVEHLSGLSISDKQPEIALVLIDTAEWKTVVDKLYRRLVTPPPLSKYASASAREGNSALLPARTVTATFRLEDVLQLSQSQLADLVGKRPVLFTLLFTLNELYTTSIGKTTAFLLNLTTAAEPGTLLLVVDSPGSYSETTVGTEAKKYPMKWLLDHTLLETEKSRGEESLASWEKVVSEDSQWFRLPEGLRYPIPLENMRYQVHLYRRM